MGLGAPLSLRAVAVDESRRAGLEPDSHESFADGAVWAACCIFALVGMALAIRAGRFCISCDRSLPLLSQEFCDHCVARDRAHGTPSLCGHCGSW